MAENPNYVLANVHVKKRTLHGMQSHCMFNLNLLELGKGSLLHLRLERTAHADIKCIHPPHMPITLVRDEVRVFTALCNAHFSDLNTKHR